MCVFILLSQLCIIIRISLCHRAWPLLAHPFLTLRCTWCFWYFPLCLSICIKITNCAVWAPVLSSGLISDWWVVCFREKKRCSCCSFRIGFLMTCYLCYDALALVQTVLKEGWGRTERRTAGLWTDSVDDETLRCCLVVQSSITVGTHTVLNVVYIGITGLL